MADTTRDTDPRAHKTEANAAQPRMEVAESPQTVSSPSSEEAPKTSRSRRVEATPEIQTPRLRGSSWAEDVELTEHNTTKKNRKRKEKRRQQKNVKFTKTRAGRERTGSEESSYETELSLIEEEEPIEERMEGVEIAEEGVEEPEIVEAGRADGENLFPLRTTKPNPPPPTPTNPLHLGHRPAMMPSDLQMALQRLDTQRRLENGECLYPIGRVSSNSDIPNMPVCPSPAIGRQPRMQAYNTPPQTIPPSWRYIKHFRNIDHAHTDKVIERDSEMPNAESEPAGAPPKQPTPPPQRPATPPPTKEKGRRGKTSKDPPVAETKASRKARQGGRREAGEGGKKKTPEPDPAPTSRKAKRSTKGKAKAEIDQKVADLKVKSKTDKSKQKEPGKGNQSEKGGRGVQRTRNVQMSKHEREKDSRVDGLSERLTDGSFLYIRVPHAHIGKGTVSQSSVNAAMLKAGVKGEDVLTTYPDKQARGFVVSFKDAATAAPMVGRKLTLGSLKEPLSLELYRQGSARKFLITNVAYNDPPALVRGLVELLKAYKKKTAFALAQAEEGGIRVSTYIVYFVHAPGFSRLDFRVGESTWMASLGAMPSNQNCSLCQGECGPDTRCPSARDVPVSTKEPLQITTDEWRRRVHGK